MTCCETKSSHSARNLGRVNNKFGESRRSLQYSAVPIPLSFPFRQGNGDKGMKKNFATSGCPTAESCIAMPTAKLSASAEIIYERCLNTGDLQQILQALSAHHHIAPMKRHSRSANLSQPLSFAGASDTPGCVGDACALRSIPFIGIRS